MVGTCRLCGQKAELQESHIVPAFVYRWLRETSGTGYFRFGQTPNKRVQDGLKKYWLCSTCEQLLNVWETEFANNLFHPYNKDGGTRVHYKDWLLKFCASISWRTLSLHLDLDRLKKGYNETEHTDEIKALHHWGQFILGKTKNPGPYEQHILPLDTVETTSMDAVPPNFNRYLLRAVDLDVVRGGDINFVYSKISRFIIIGFINLPYPDEWVGTKVHIHKGTIAPRKYTMPQQFGDYMMGRARRIRTLLGQLSEPQRRKIQDSIKANPEKMVTSECFQAFLQDYKLFGSEAFEKPLSKKE